MKTNAGSLQKGNFINHQGGVFQVVNIDHAHHGRGSANIKFKIKNVSSGNVRELTLKPDNAVDQVSVDSTQMQFLFSDGRTLTFMNETTYEQVEIEARIVGNLAKYLKEGQKMFVYVHDGKALSVRPPGSVTLKVTEAEDAVKGDTATGAKKTVTLETGVTAQVPLFIKKGSSIVVNPETGAYVERA